MRQENFRRRSAQVELAIARLALIREGIEANEPDDVMGVRKWRPGREPRIESGRGSAEGRRLAFHVPTSRAYRLTNAAGATSFHFQHRYINKVTHEMQEEGLRNRPGAARAHSRYIEREAAVALIEQGTDEQLIERSTSMVGLSEVAEPVPDTTFITTSNSNSNSNSTFNKENDYDWHKYHGLEPLVAGGLVEELAGPESCPVGIREDGAGKRAKSDAGMWLLPRRDVVRNGRRTHGLLLGAQDVPVEAPEKNHRLRQPAPSLGSQSSPGDGIATLRSAGEASDHDRYIGRMDAVAVQPDGRRALITNIDPDDDERARFWSLVEEHEGTASADQMSLRIADRPRFWAAVAEAKDCPAELKQALQTNRPDETIRFDVASGKAMRAFLQHQPGWVPRKHPVRAACQGQAARAI